MMAANGELAGLHDEARQLGQLFMMGFDGTTINDQVRTLIEKYHVGSILLTAKNLKSAAQTAQLVFDLQTLAHNSGHPVPLLIAIDQENGGVNSLYDEIYIRQFPSAMGVAAGGSKKLARDVARATADELAACGINWILGPVLDVLTNARNQPLGVRSVGDDPQEVSAYGIEYIKGYQEGGLATCGKHFPSYGNLEFFGAPTDVPTITDSLEHLSQSAMVPFRNAIALGIDAMMVGGVAMASSGVNVMHACLSEQVVRDLLRHEMQFQGVVVSECLEMEALSRNIGISGGTVMAFQAGCDVILTCRSLPAQEEAIAGLKAGLDNGMIERFRVQESVQRVHNMKSRYTSWDRAFTFGGIDTLAKVQPSHLNLSTTVYNKSITIVRDRGPLLPLSRIIQSNQELLLLTPLVKPLPASAAYRNLYETQNSHNADQLLDSDPKASIMVGEKVFRELGRALARQRGGKILHTSYTANGVGPIHENLLERAQAVIVVTADATRNKYQHGFTKHVSMLCKMAVGPNGVLKEKPCIVVAVSSPFDFAVDSTIGTYICTYDFTETALRALVKVLYGELSATGTLTGSYSRKLHTNHNQQQWLVENFNEERDSVSLDALLLQVSNEGSTHSSVLKFCTSNTFLLSDPNIEESHFVVRNSSTKEIFGFCATYYSKTSGHGSIGAIVVDPARRQKAIGASLHNRAIRALLQKKGIQKFWLGTRLPNVYLGIPKDDPNEHRKLRQWFAKLGWNVSVTTPVSTRIIRDLGRWGPPDSLGQMLNNPDIKYDLVHGAEYTEALMDHLKQCGQMGVSDMYQRAIDNKEACGIIRAKRAADGAILGSILLGRGDSRLTDHVPELSQVASRGCVSSPVIAPSVTDRGTLLQSLALLAVRQFKKQGIRTIIFDRIREDVNVSGVQALGFMPFHSFDEVSSEPAYWTANSVG